MKLITRIKKAIGKGLRGAMGEGKTWGSNPTYKFKMKTK